MKLLGAAWMGTLASLGPQLLALLLALMRVGKAAGASAERAAFVLMSRRPKSMANVTYLLTKQQAAATYVLQGTSRRQFLLTTHHSLLTALKATPRRSAPAPDAAARGC